MKAEQFADGRERERPVDCSDRDPGQMESDLRELLATIQNPHLRRLLAMLFGEHTSTWPEFRDVPAAKHYHQAYRHGLLEHCLTVAQATHADLDDLPRHRPRPRGRTGALLHDIGKLEAYETRDDAAEMSDLGRLHGEIPLGYYTRPPADRAGRRLPCRARSRSFCTSSSATTARSSTGAQWSRAPREATLVHMMDNLGGRSNT